MKIGGGGNPYRGGSVGQSSRSSKSKGTKKSKYAGKAESASEVATPDAVEAADEVDSPIYDAMEAASQQYDDEDSLEDATEAVVAAVIHEHFGKKGLPENEMKQITQAVTSSLTGDNQMRSRMESVLRRISAKRK